MALLDFVRHYLGEPAPERQHQKVKTNLDLLEQEIVSGSGISWAICKICTLTQTHNHSSIPPLSFYYSAKRGLAITCHLSVYLSVCDVGGL